MGYGNNFHDLASLHPHPVQIFRMWQTFLINVNPLVKMFHAPTVQQMILDASGDLKNIARPTEALMFSIYFLSITSLQNEECESMFGESRPSLLAKYSYAAQQALINARFLKSLNLFTLQALILYLVSRISDIIWLSPLSSAYCFTIIHSETKLELGVHHFEPTSIILLPLTSIS